MTTDGLYLPPRMAARRLQREIERWEAVLHHPLSPASDQWFAHQRLYELRIQFHGGFGDAAPIKRMARAGARKKYLGDTANYAMGEEPMVQHLCPQRWPPMVERLGLTTAEPLGGGFIHDATQLIGCAPRVNESDDYLWGVYCTDPIDASRTLGPVVLQASPASGRVLVGAETLQALSDFNRAFDGLLDDVRNLTEFYGGRYQIVATTQRH